MRVSSEVRKRHPRDQIQKERRLFADSLPCLRILDYRDCARARVPHLGTEAGNVRWTAAQPVSGCRLPIR
jgi:hypothetical protein